MFGDDRTFFCSWSKSESKIPGGRIRWADKSMVVPNGLGVKIAHRRKRECSTQEGTWTSPYGVTINGYIRWWKLRVHARKMDITLRVSTILMKQCSIVENASIALSDRFIC